MANEMHQDKVPEPIEIRLLKQKLACFACKCLNCEKYNRSNRINKLKNGESTGVQVDKSNSGRFSKYRTRERIDDKPKRIDKATGSNFISTLCNNYICPSCRYIVEFLREHLNKVYKDVESETNPVVRCDKSTVKTLDYLDKTTSMMKCNSSCPMKKKSCADFNKAENKERKCQQIVFEDSIKDDTDLGKNKKVTVCKDKGNIAKLKNITVDNEKPVHTEKQTSSDVIKQMHMDTKHSQYICENCICVEKFIKALRAYA